MSQKSILSFFKQADKTLKVEPKKCESSIERSSNVDSPIKKTRKRKVKQITDSDEDSNGSHSEFPKSIKDESERMESGQVSDSNTKISEEGTVTSKSTVNGELASSKCNGTPRKRKKGSEVDSSDTKCVKKEKLDNSEENTNNIENEVNGINDVSTENLPSTSTAEEQKHTVPKRKTARKSMKSGKVTGKQKLCEKSSDSHESSEAPSNDKITGDSSQNHNQEEKMLQSENSASAEDNKSNTVESTDNLGETQKLNNVEESNNKLDKSESLDEDKSEKVKEEDNEKECKSEKVKEEDNEKECKSGNIQKEDKSENLKKERKSGNVKKEGKSGNIKKKIKIEKEEKEENGEVGKEDKAEKMENSAKSIHPFFDKQKKNVESPKENSTKNSVKKASAASSGVAYDPSKNKYHPIDDACWKHGEKVPYLALAKTLDLIENTSARLKIVEILSNFFRSVIVLTPEDLLQSLYLCLNRIAPEYEGIELGIGDMVLMKAVAQTTGRTLEKIRAEVKEKGDLGLVAESSRGNQKIMFAPPKLTVASVFSKFKEIAKMSGNAVMAKKTDKIQVLLVACQNCEAKFIIRSLSGKLRIGLAEQSVLAALARAAVITPPAQSYPPEVIDKSSGMSSENFKKLLDAKSLILKTTYSECPNFDLVIPVLLKEGIDGLPKHCQLSPGCPLKPMLAHPTTGIDEVLQRFDNNEFTCEFKYDGERAQIHRNEKGEVKIFSRNQEDNTSKYPDVIARIPKTLKDSTQSFIIDTEAVAWDSETQTILPFQVLSTRKKKDAVESEITVQVCVMAFDLLYLNGESLVKKKLKERRELLHSSFVEVPNKFMFVTYKDGNNAEIMQEFLDESVKGNCEGLMVKALEVDASYEIAKRSHNWLKLKKDYLNGVGDTLDLLVIGGYFGKGKRTGNYGGFLLACYDDENEEFQSICKLGTGFKDSELESHTKFLKEHVIESPKSYYRCDHSLEPDEWFEAVQVWEIKCADLSISPIHKAAAGIVDPEKGISLRFPRFIKIRDDKKPEDATSSSQVAEMYQRQEQVKSMKSKTRPEEDYY